jgi:ferredoxin
VKVRIDTEACTGHGRCYTLAPQVFDSDDRGYGSVISEDLSEELLAQATIGVQNCPEQAISIVED